MLEDHLAAHWTFDETEGSVVYDASSNAFHGTVYGAARADGIRSGALDFNGIDNAVHIPELGMAPPDKIGTLETGTIALWFRFREFTDEMIPLFYFGESDHEADHNSLIIEIGHGSSDNRKLYFTIINTQFCYDSGQNLLPDTWTHFAAVVSTTGNTGYLNGEEMIYRHYNLGSTARFTDFFASVPAKHMLAIGYGRYGKADPFMHYSGLIDDVRIYDRALTAQEIKSVYEGKSTAIQSKKIRQPGTFYLFQNTPNPFNPTTEIRFGIPTRSHVKLKVYNVLGVEATTLIDGMLQVGTHTAQFDGSALPSGIYYYVLTTDHTIQTRKCVLIK
jgi:hypothetical protein